jgi:hypothetical protein
MKKISQFPFRLNPKIKATIYTTLIVLGIIGLIISFVKFTLVTLITVTSLIGLIAIIHGIQWIYNEVLDEIRDRS